MSKFELDLSGPVLKLYMGWKIPFKYKSEWEGASL